MAEVIAQADVVVLKERDPILIEMGKAILRNHSAVAGLIIIGFLVILAIFAPVFAPHDPSIQLFGEQGWPQGTRLPNHAPCIPAFGCDGPLHWMGLDGNARDLWSRVVYGARVSLVVGLAAVSFAITVGTVIGLIAGYAGGWVDNLIMRFMDVLLAFPALLLAITIVTIFGRGLQNALLAIAIVSIPSYARIVRASVLTLKEQEFVTAAKALGTGHIRILFLQIFPNALTPLIVQATLGIGTAILDAAALSFIGLGAQPPTAEWGYMLSEARTAFRAAPHLMFFPGVAIMLTVLGFNLLGDGLRDILDPRLRKN